MEAFWTIVVIGGLLALMIWGFVEKSKDNAARKESLIRFHKDMSKRGFTATRLYTSESIFLAVDTTESCRLAYALNPSFASKFVDATKILSVSVYEDQRSIEHAHRGRQIGAAVVGNALAGSTGAIIGGLGAKNKSTDVVKSISLRVELDDPQTPILDVNFLKGQTNRGGFAHEKTNREARAWSSMITALMRRSESPKPTAVPAPAPDTAPAITGSGTSRIESLKKLGELKDNGILTSEEFDREKARILDGD